MTVEEAYYLYEKLSDAWKDLEAGKERLASFMLDQKCEKVFKIQEEIALLMDEIHEMIEG